MPAVSQHTPSDSTRRDVKPDLERRILTSTEAKAENFLNQGLQKVQTQDYKRAIEDFTQALQINHISAYLDRGNVRRQIGDN